MSVGPRVLDVDSILENADTWYMYNERKVRITVSIFSMGYFLLTRNIYKIYYFIVNNPQSFATMTYFLALLWVSQGYAPKIE